MPSSPSLSSRSTPSATALGLALSLVAVGALGCAATEPQSTCDDAAAHYAACTGGSAEGFSGACGADAQMLAEVTLASSCAELASPAGKSDAVTETGLCIALVLPLLIVHEQDLGDPCCVPYNCKEGLVCNTEGSKTCQPPVATGGACSSTWDCEGGLRCVFDECAAPVGDGGSCGDDGDCGEGLTCLEGQCGAPRPTGEACEEGGDCVDGLICLDALCAPRLEVGESCAYDGQCAAGFVCLDGACQTQLCEGDFGCGIDTICWQGACEPKHAVDEPCERSFDCLFGLFCSSDNVCYDPFD